MNASKRIAVVTGASRGIGATVAQQLAREGFFVIVNFASNEAKAAQVLNAIRASGGDGALLKFDVSDAKAVEQGFEAIAEEHGAVEVLVNNAGISIDNLLMRVKPEEVDRILDVDLKGTIYCTKEATRQMMKPRKGSVITISSVIGECGNPGQSLYAAAKAGLFGFSKSVARELASRGIRVNVVTPGYIQTDMTDALTEAQKEAMLRAIPLGTIGNPEDVAYTVAFLASDRSRYITGQVIGVNGGLYM